VQTRAAWTTAGASVLELRELETQRE
jgi:hypothetical protein